MNNPDLMHLAEKNLEKAEFLLNQVLQQPFAYRDWLGENAAFFTRENIIQLGQARANLAVAYLELVDMRTK